MIWGFTTKEVALLILTVIFMSGSISTGIAGLGMIGNVILLGFFVEVLFRLLIPLEERIIELEEKIDSLSLRRKGDD